jgi:Family of unknown function (DUF6445)
MVLDCAVPDTRWPALTHLRLASVIVSDETSARPLLGLRVKPQLLRVGRTHSPVVVIDGFSGAVDDIARLADELGPFPPIRGNYYPGVRRLISNSDAAAYAYVIATCRNVAPFVGGAFGGESFDLEEASFSVVSLRPEQLQPVQKAPHFDGPDQKLYALLHYLRVPSGSGTAFFRHRATGIERVTPQNLPLYASAAERELPTTAARAGYINGSDDLYEEIGRVEAIADRLIVYHGSLLHSGIIPQGMSFSADPQQGRLTANFFLIGR